jgi:hypothetical protein
VSDWEYAVRFKEETLDALNANTVAQEISELSKSKNNARLLCYEPPSKFCHRRLVAIWLEVSHASSWVHEVERSRTGQLSPTMSWDAKDFTFRKNFESLLRGEPVHLATQNFEFEQQTLFAL